MCATAGEIVDVERWWGCGVERMDTCGVADQRKLAQAEGHKLAEKLKPQDGVFKGSLLPPKLVVIVGLMTS